MLRGPFLGRGLAAFNRAGLSLDMWGNFFQVSCWTTAAGEGELVMAALRVGMEGHDQFSFPLFFMFISFFIYLYK